MAESVDSSHTSRTDWSMVLDAAAVLENNAAGDALERLVRRYWPSVYAYLRSYGLDVHEAADRTQGFVCDVLLGRRLIQGADPARGRFRGLLLHSLRNYIRDQYRSDQRTVEGRRSVQPLSMVEADMRAADHWKERSPPTAFAAQWSSTMLRRVLESVREACMRDGLDVHWHIFEHRAARAMMFGEAPVPYAQLIERYNLDDASQASNMMVTVKRRFARALYDEILQTVVDETQVEEEVYSLLRELERP